MNTKDKKNQKAKDWKDIIRNRKMDSDKINKKSCKNTVQSKM